MILVNGKQQSSLNISDRGLQYGDGVFETIAIKKGKPCLLESHLSRLEVSCNRLKIFWIWPVELLLSEIHQAIQHLDHGILKIIITRGEGGRGYSINSALKPTRILSTHTWPTYPDSLYDGITVRFCETRLGQNSLLAGIKHLNRLEQVMARSEWQDPAIFEGLMEDSDGFLVEGTMSNVFLRVKDKLITPDLSRNGVNGVMRQLILALCKQHKITTIEKRIVRDDLLKAEEIFITNSIIGVVPIIAIVDFAQYDVGFMAKQLREWVGQAEQMEMLR